MVASRPGLGHPQSLEGTAQPARGSLAGGGPCPDGPPRCSVLMRWGPTHRWDPASVTSIRQTQLPPPTDRASAMALSSLRWTPDPWRRTATTRCPLPRPRAPGSRGGDHSPRCPSLGQRRGLSPRESGRASQGGQEDTGSPTTKPRGCPLAGHWEWTMSSEVACRPRLGAPRWTPTAL